MTSLRVGRRRLPGGQLCILLFIATSLAAGAAGCSCSDPTGTGTGDGVEQTPPEAPGTPTGTADPTMHEPNGLIEGETELPLLPPPAPPPPPPGIDLELECADADRDGYGVGTHCLGPDCDDGDASIGPTARRGCYSGPPELNGVGVCAGGVQTCTAGTWDAACVGEVLPSLELCDRTDNNCNGSVDDKVTRHTRSGSEQPVEVVYRPVDVILVVDNSGSMGEEIAAVEQNINQNFADIIGQSGLDYRVILISQHGTTGATGGYPICVGSPLGGNDCTQPTACPSNGSRFFHYSVDIGSLSSLSQILGTFHTADACGLAPGGWSGWLRPDARKVFIEVTDHGPNTGSGANSMTAQQFDDALLALSPAHFGTSAARNYEFHTIAGFRENSPADAPWLPGDPLVSQLCTGNGGKVTNPGIEYQRLSQWTGGLRFPICEYQSFDAVFQTVARGVLIGSQLACAFKAPPEPPDSTLRNAYLEFIPTNGGATTPLMQVSDASACSGFSFYVVGDELHLCEDACAAWQKDPTALVDVLYTCTDQLQP